jgi:hypothetical protein
LSIGAVGGSAIDFNQLAQESAQRELESEIDASEELTAEEKRMEEEQRIAALQETNRPRSASRNDHRRVSISTAIHTSSDGIAPNRPGSSLGMTSPHSTNASIRPGSALGHSSGSFARPGSALGGRLKSALKKRSDTPTNGNDESPTASRQLTTATPLWTKFESHDDGTVTFDWGFLGNHGERQDQSTTVTDDDVTSPLTSYRPSLTSSVPTRTIEGDEKRTRPPSAGSSRLPQPPPAPRPQLLGPRPSSAGNNNSQTLLLPRSNHAMMDD